MIGVNSGLLITVACVGCFCFGFYSAIQFKNARLINELETVIKEKDKADSERIALEAKLNAARGAQERKAKVIVKKVDHEIEKVVYRECVVPDDGVRLINEAAGLYTAR